MSAILSAAPAIFNLVQGSIQRQNGKKLLSGLQRPQYQRPADIDQALTLAQANYADPRFAGQARAENQIAQNSANALQMAADYGNPMHQIANVLAQQNQGAQQIAAQQEQSQQNDLQNLQQMGQVMAGYKDTEWQMNKFAPYSEKYNEGREMIGAGQINQATGLQGLSNVAAAYMSTMPGAQPKHSPAAVSNVTTQAPATTATQQKTSNVLDSISKFMLGQMNEGINMYKGTGLPMDFLKNPGNIPAMGY